MFGLAGITLPAEVTPYVYGAVAILTRLSMMMAFLPAIGEMAVPMRVRMAIVFTLCFAMVPAVLPQQIQLVADTNPLLLIANEAMIGFALGFGFRVLIFTLSIAGTIISQSMSLSQIFGAGVVTEPSTTVSTLLIMAGATLFVTLDLHTYCIGLLMESYQLFPLAEVPDTGGLAQWATKRTVGAFNIAVSLSLPFILISFLYNVILGLINQAMPQMMVTFIGVPLNVLAGIFILALAIGAILTAWVAQLDTGFAGFW